MTAFTARDHRRNHDSEAGNQLIPGFLRGRYGTPLGGVGGLHDDAARRCIALEPSILPEHTVVWTDARIVCSDGCIMPPSGHGRTEIVHVASGEERQDDIFAGRAVLFAAVRIGLVGFGGGALLPSCRAVNDPHGGPCGRNLLRQSGGLTGGQKPSLWQGGTDKRGQDLNPGIGLARAHPTPEALDNLEGSALARDQNTESRLVHAGKGGFSATARCALAGGMIAQGLDFVNRPRQVTLQEEEHAFRGRTPRYGVTEAWIRMEHIIITHHIEPPGEKTLGDLCVAVKNFSYFQ